MLDKITHRIKHQDCCPKQHLQRVHQNALHKLTQAFLREKIFTATYQSGRLTFSLPKTTRLLCVDTTQMGSLARYRTGGNIYVQGSNGSVRQITHPLELLDICTSELKLEYDHQRWEGLSQEITDHLQNALLSSYKSCTLSKKIAEEAKNNQCQNVVEWLLSREDRLDAAVFFEQWASRGHPYHPCSKTKLGFSLEDVVSYSPEFHPVVSLPVFAVRRDYMHVEEMDAAQTGAYADWFSLHYADTWQQWCAAMANRELATSEYIPLPVHPWQAKNRLPELFEDCFESGIMHELPDVFIDAAPTLSFRTLAPMSAGNCAYIKLPVAVQATSVFRTLSPGSTENTPKVSRILQNILKKENDFGGKLSILCEMFGLHMKHIPDEQAKHLTAIFRENPRCHLNEDEICIVVAALFEKSPVTEMNLFIELMQSSGANNLADALTYFTHYVHLVLGVYLDLYLVYGIALEGHQQNTLAVFKQGNIVRFIARDFDGTDMHAESIATHGIEFTPYIGSPNLMPHKHMVRNNLLHTVYQAHLGELVLLLASHYKCDEKLFWEIIKRATHERFVALKDRLPEAVWEADYQAILRADWPCKALLRMRLQKKYNPEGLFFKIANPLSYQN